MTPQHRLVRTAGRTKVCGLEQVVALASTQLAVDQPAALPVKQIELIRC